VNQLENVSFSHRLVTVSFSHKTEDKIWGFRDLKRGWHFGEGKPIDKTGIDEALHLHSEILLHRFTRTDAFPGLNGEIQLTIYSNNDYFEFTREPTGKWTFVHEHLEAEVDVVGELTLTDLQEKIVGSLEERICNTSELYHENTGTPIKSGLQRLPLSRPATMESPSSKSSVFLKSQRLFAITSENTIHTFPVNRQSFGNFQTIFFRQAFGLYRFRVIEATSATATSQD